MRGNSCVMQKFQITEIITCFAVISPLLTFNGNVNTLDTQCRRTSVHLSVEFKLSGTSKPSSDGPSSPVQYDTVKTPCHCTNPTVESQCNLYRANECLTELNILPLQAASHSQTTGNGLCITIWSSRPDHLHRAEEQLSGQLAKQCGKCRTSNSRPV